MTIKEPVEQGGEVARPSCKDCRVGRGYRPFLDYVELCPRHAAVDALMPLIARLTRDLDEMIDTTGRALAQRTLNATAMMPEARRAIEAAREVLAAATKGQP